MGKEGERASETGRDPRSVTGGEGESDRESCRGGDMGIGEKAQQR